MKRNRRQLLGWAFVLGTGWAAARNSAFADEKPKQGTADDLPQSWSLDEIAQATPPYATEAAVRVLAWKIMHDQERDFRVESCLVMKVLDKDDEHGRWCLAQLYRHPHVEKPEWQLGTIHVSGKKGTKYFPGLWIHQSKRFKTRPTNKELYASLSTEEVGWTFDQPEGWRYVSCGVCEKTWLDVIGEKPARFFGK